MTERRRLSDENKAIALRLIDEVLNAHSLALCDDLYDPNYEPHSLPPGFSPDREGVKQYHRHYFQAFPDMHLTVDGMLAEGDWVAVYYTGTGTHQGELIGIPPTGKQVTASAILSLRIVDGKIVEDRLDGDKLGLLQQLGVIPSSTHA
jgi:predicted SnoaL-like aldol condensation-catalyzing enzyme